MEVHEYLIEKVSVKPKYKIGQEVLYENILYNIFDYINLDGVIYYHIGVDFYVNESKLVIY